VEFIVTGDAGEFFFLEMNTRLQVEHPVTELVYGVDLVAQQLRIAAGEPLALHQEQLLPRGHAVEARIYAEDPSAGFLPSTGTVRVYREPEQRGVRVDSGIRAGTQVGTAYDPMLAKVIAHGADRPTALRRLSRALATFDLVGVSTSAAFTRALLERDDVRAGELDTGLLERVLAELAGAPPDDLIPAAALAAAGTSRPDGPWWRRLAGHGDVRVHDDRVTLGERSWQPVAVRFDAEGAARVMLDGVERRYAFHVTDDAIWIARDGHHIELRSERAQRAAAASSGSLEAPMPGTVLLVNVADGDAVATGDVLLVLESMKMEVPIAAPYAGTVAGLELRPGDGVALGQLLVAVVAPDTEEAT
jgi:acetyl-CoA/propionyl-CoA carboxylase biotin carboxyl carrier protein